MLGRSVVKRMMMKEHNILILSVITFNVSAIEILKTEKQPSMKILDENHVLIDYENSFVMKNFSSIKAVSVYLSNSTKNIAVATTEDITGASSKLKIFQKLKRKSKLKGKLNPCEKAKFFVRIKLETGFLDSVEGTYNPDLQMVTIISSSVCVSERFVMFPHQVEDMPLLSSCLGNISTLVQGNAAPPPPQFVVISSPGMSKWQVFVEFVRFDQNSTGDFLVKTWTTQSEPN